MASLTIYRVSAETHATPKVRARRAGLSLSGTPRREFARFADESALDDLATRPAAPSTSTTENP